MPPNPYRLRARAIIGTVLVVVLGVAAYGVYTGFKHVTAAAPPAPGCQAGTGTQAITLDTGQAAIAATIAGVAARHKLPAEAVTIAYAAALQESQLQDLTYGDRDSVGIFQQRPSQGWGTTSELEDPVYATTKFFQALVQVHDYKTMPVEVAAQAVQHSADGTAYAQWTQVASQLAGYFTGKDPHGVSCWYVPAGQANLSGVEQQITQTFGPQGHKAVVLRFSTARSAQKSSEAVVQVRQSSAWTVAGWLVAYAQTYGLTEVRYAGYEWEAADGSMGWQHVSGTSANTSPPRGSIVAG
ncbi:MAG: hypothetical protein WAK82_21165 [Streptosporangiaceae bacterium]